jgi:hypothetical protein
LPWCVFPIAQAHVVQAFSHVIKHGIKTCCNLFWGTDIKTMTISFANSINGKSFCSSGYHERGKEKAPVSYLFLLSTGSLQLFYCHQHKFFYQLMCFCTFFITHRLVLHFIQLKTPL